MNLKSITKRYCILIGAGEPPSYPVPVSQGDYLIAVDGGYGYCKKWGLEPDLVIGDFDSAGQELKEEIQNIRRQNPDRAKELPVMKDDTDMLAALRVGLSKGYRYFRLYGGMGGRTDHTIANIQCLLFLKEQGAEGCLLSDQEALFLIQNQSLKLPRKSFGFFSLFALQNRAEGVTIRGMKYPLRQATLTDAYPLGISNEFIGEEAEVTVERGTLLAVMQRGQKRFLTEKRRTIMAKKPAVLMILDGYGLNGKTEGNAVALAKTPVMDRLMAEYPFVKGNASGMAVGLPEGQMGNSEVGHLNMGAGRIVYQELTRITKEIQEGTFFENPALLDAVQNCKEKDSALHMFGLLSDGGVHSHNTHLYGLLELAKRNGLSKVYVHAFLDGRDTPPASGKGFVEDLEAQMQKIGVGEVATVTGRYYAMDRDNNYDRVEKAYRALTRGEGLEADSAAAGIQASYDRDETDEFVKPTVVMKNGAPVATIKDGDSVIFFNFRPDRAREITRSFCDDDFKGFAREKRLDLVYVCFSDYDPTIPHKEVAFHKIAVTNTFGEWLAANHMKQARIAETEKYAHVTFFFNGGVEEPNEGEDRILVNSPKDVATYDLKPQMSAYEVCDKLTGAIRSGEYDVIIINFANPDMVGHTGVQEAAIKAVEAVDECVGKAVEAIKEVDGVMFICADHGNAEQLVDYETGAPFTAHTTNPVPFILVNAEPSYRLREGGCLADIVPTLIELMGKEQPAEMTGKSLLIK